MNGRRRLLALAAAAGAVGVAPAGLRGTAAAGQRAVSGSAARRLLILGGTGFIGPHLTRAAQERGWVVTHFNRGRREPGGAAGVETLVGDRSGSLEALRGGRWDAVVDNTGYVPKYVRASSELLAPLAAQAIFVSSISAYADFSKPNDERSATGVLADPQADKVTNETYGPMKALCERYVLEAFANRAAIVRPGYIVGPLDPTDRFTYWPVRYSRGGEMLMPGTPRDPIQIVDVRDLSDFVLRLLDRQARGIYNVVSAPRELTMGRLVEACRRAAPEAATRTTWVDERFLEQQWGEEGTDLAPWAPVAGKFAGASLSATARARRAGLRIRPLETTVRDTLAWFRSLPAERQAKLRAGLPSEREQQTLAAWHARSGGAGSAS